MALIYFQFFSFNDADTTKIYTLSLHDALPIFRLDRPGVRVHRRYAIRDAPVVKWYHERLPSSSRRFNPGRALFRPTRSEEHTSELQSRVDLVCRLLLEKKK